MSQIKCKDTKPELILRHALFNRGFRYRLHVSSLPGKPDLVLKKYNSVVFVHGCFWHGHANCKYFVIPKTNTDWWQKKINSNSDRDKSHRTALRKNGWNVFVVWECELRKKSTLVNLENRLKKHG